MEIRSFDKSSLILWIESYVASTKTEVVAMMQGIAYVIPEFEDAVKWQPFLSDILQYYSKSKFINNDIGSDEYWHGHDLSIKLGTLDMISLLMISRTLMALKNKAEKLLSE